MSAFTIWCLLGVFGIVLDYVLNFKRYERDGINATPLILLVVVALSVLLGPITIAAVVSLKAEGWPDNLKDDEGA